MGTEELKGVLAYGFKQHSEHLDFYSLNPYERKNNVHYMFLLGGGLLYYIQI